MPTAAAKLQFPLGEPFFDELQRRCLLEFRAAVMETSHTFTAGEKRVAPVPVSSVLLSAFDPKDSVIIEASVDLDITYFEEQVKEKKEKIQAYVKEQAEKRGLKQLEGRWVPA